VRYINLTHVGFRLHVEILSRVVSSRECGAVNSEAAKPRVTLTMPALFVDRYFTVASIFSHTHTQASAYTAPTVAKFVRNLTPSDPGPKPNPNPTVQILATIV